jgi:hypothetical protein
VIANQKGIPNMTESTDLENLQKLRDGMVTRRRYLARDAIYMCAVNNQDLSETARCPEIVGLQGIIEGLDRAIADEKSLTPTTVSTPIFAG